MTGATLPLSIMAWATGASGGLMSLNFASSAFNSAQRLASGPRNFLPASLGRVVHGGLGLVVHLPLDGGALIGGGGDAVLNLRREFVENLSVEVGETSSIGLSADTDVSGFVFPDQAGRPVPSGARPIPDSRGPRCGCWRRRPGGDSNPCTGLDPNL